MNKFVGLVLTSCLSGYPAVAYADSGLDLQIVAHVDTFCHIYPPSGLINIRNGFAAIGQVHEVCNTPSGYDVSASFSNLASGNLEMGGLGYTLVDGSAIRSSDTPAVKTMAWDLTDVKLDEASQPVVMQVTISPR